MAASAPIVPEKNRMLIKGGDMVSEISITSRSISDFVISVEKSWEENAPLPAGEIHLDLAGL